MSSPCGPTRAARRASVSSISASSPVVSAWSGSAACSSRARRIASFDRSVRCRVGAGAGGIALVEDEVEHVQDGVEPGLQLLRRRPRERHARRLDAGLGAADALRHRRFGHEERAGDLGRGQAADRAQGEGDGRRAGERRMTAHHQQVQRVVLVRGSDGVRRRRRLGRHLEHHDCFAAAAGDLGADLVGQASGGDVDQPPARIGRQAVARPLPRRRQQRLLHRVLGGREIAEAADDRAEHLRRQLAQQAVGNRCHSCGGALITWRTSIGMFIGTPPLPGAAEARAAMA